LAAQARLKSRRDKINTAIAIAEVSSTSHRAVSSLPL
jgi:hypothetical protein